MNAVRNIGTRLEPFIDDWLIERMDGMSLRLHQPVPKEVAFRFDRPWEGTSSIFIRVMKDGDLYRSWYRAGADRDQSAAYVESANGIVSVHAPYTGGEFVTRPLIFVSDELVLNYATSAAGSIRVEVQDAKGSPVPDRSLSDCDEIFGDEIERVVTWRGSGNVGSLAGRPVRLRLKSANYADFYSVRFRQSVSLR